ncbi:uncharacterized protein J7T54_003092 [Emericellopsis cladophorae]|uniref:Beta-cyclopiazonate dehydrogenase n=1 Tax=Emericellopsis cladophorae TaxID=2686198 RepID=A0A9Q0BDV3_9HYPO|nr:uncharacterized protein J7T54_003092 [Emericellopsis cladophorae]KAI6780950.1 hypothetical protein J7T54_003092 [Emericellopsis cladophorae]
MSHFTATLGLLALATLAATTEVKEVDVAVVGGGASGAYAAFRLQEDYGKSIALIEREQRLGGHVNSYRDPATGENYEAGVVAFADIGNAADFFDRLGIERGPTRQQAVATTYYDFKTGEEVDYTPASLASMFAAIEKFLVPVEKYEPLFQDPGFFNFPAPEDIPEDLLLPFGEFLTKYDAEDAMPLIYSNTALGLGNVTNEVTLFALQAFGGANGRGAVGRQPFFSLASGRVQDLYDAVGEVLGDSVLYGSNVASSKHTEKGVEVEVKDLETGEFTKVLAKKLLIAIEPSQNNLAPFGIDETAREVLSKFHFSAVYTGIIDNAGLEDGRSYFNMPSAAAPDHSLILPEAPNTPRIDWLGPGHKFRITLVGEESLSAQDAKDMLQGDFSTLVEAGVIDGEAGEKVSYVDFNTHGPMHARASAEDVGAGFIQDLYALQGRQNTWWTGGAWAPGFQTLLWQFDDVILPKIVEQLE